MVEQCPPGMPSFETFLATWDAHVTPDEQCGLEAWLDLTHPGVDLLSGDAALDWIQHSVSNFDNRSISASGA